MHVIPYQREAHLHKLRELWQHWLNHNGPHEDMLGDGLVIEEDGELLAAVFLYKDSKTPFVFIDGLISNPLVKFNYMRAANMLMAAVKDEAKKHFAGRQGVLTGVTNNWHLGKLYRKRYGFKRAVANCALYEWTE